MLGTKAAAELHGHCHERMFGGSQNGHIVEFLGAFPTHGGDLTLLFSSNTDGGDSSLSPSMRMPLSSSSQWW
jgi:hypothetical protein